MREHSEQHILPLLAITLVLIAQCTSTIVYKCNNDTIVCGCSKRPGISLKIIGGSSAGLSNWDWVVSLRDVNNTHFCGGSIINEWYIITAAHCLEHKMHVISEMTVCAGTFRLSDPCYQSRAMGFPVFHPLYNNVTLENDIALVRLTTPLNFTDSSLTPICLPSADHPNEYPKVGTDVVSIGWGKLNTNQIPDELQEVTLKVMDKSSRNCNHLSNRRHQLCAGDSGKSTSPGDSGGPLMILSASKYWKIIGVASFRKHHATARAGSGYTLIAPLVQFIQNIIHTPSIRPSTMKCSCECPLGTDSGYAYSTGNSLNGCVDACKDEPSNPCNDSNTYACLGTDCAYSESYTPTTTGTTQDNQPFLGACQNRHRWSDQNCRNDEFEVVELVT